MKECAWSVAPQANFLFDALATLRSSSSSSRTKLRSVSLSDYRQKSPSVYRSTAVIDIPWIQVC